MPVRARRPIEVLPTSHARKTFTQTCRHFVEQGSDAEPVFFGSHRKPAGVMLSYALYLEILDELDNMAAALEIRERDKTDTGERVTLDAALEQLGLDRDELEKAIAAEDSTP